MSDEIYLAALVDTIIDNKYLTREFEMAHPQILLDAKAATKRVQHNAAQHGVQWTAGFVAQVKSRLSSLWSAVLRRH